MKTYFKLDALKAFQNFRPEGYLEDVLSYGQIIGDYLELEEKDAIFLVKKYKNKNPLENLLEYKSSEEVIGPDLWGPILWKVLHKRPFSIDNLNFEEYWVNIFTSWIPCGECKISWMTLLLENPIDLTSVKNYYEWTVMMHNKVNEKLNKKIFELEK
jgi:hypothetical protein